MTDDQGRFDTFDLDAEVEDPDELGPGCAGSSPLVYRLRCEWRFEGGDLSQQCEGRVQVHHTWPKAVFGPQISQGMPTTNLCQRHHNMWHEGMQRYWFNYLSNLDRAITGDD